MVGVGGGGVLCVFGYLVCSSLLTPWDHYLLYCFSNYVEGV